MTTQSLRQKIANNEFTKPTSGYCQGYVQANMVMIPKEFADTFIDFAKENEKAIPILEVIRDSHYSKTLANGADILKEIPFYNILIDGKLEKRCNNIDEYYTKDMVIFLIGCSFTFETPLIEEGIYLRHVDEGKNVAMYKSNITLNSVKNFKGNMVVSMRPIKKNRVDDVCSITSHYPSVHGSPIHIGNPLEIGISDINSPDYGDQILIKDDEVEVFWPCGVTTENVLKELKLPFAITHAPGYMFVSDTKNSEYYV